MALKGYTTAQKVKDLIPSTVSTSDATIEGWIEGVEDMIGEMTNRVFIADTNANPRLYDGDNTNTLIIEDAVEITKVEVGVDSYGGNFLEIDETGADKYFTEPANARKKDKPITMIKLNARHFPEGTQNNRITAKWGYSVDVPKDIEFATSVIVVGIVNKYENSEGGDIKSEDIGNYSVSYDTKGGNDWGDFERALDTIKQYKRQYI